MPFDPIFLSFCRPAFNEIKVPHFTNEVENSWSHFWCHLSNKSTYRTHTMTLQMLSYFQDFFFLLFLLTIFIKSLVSHTNLRNFRI